ncbi:Zinc finger protein ZIC 2 [Coemansia guatemalensis]|uniref:Zinc finger protein ZIC 2 n=1 Tax=Coemansia guatemalensis TaxID=2761395 RepID=A0A9W8HMD9_9FUNG|nr:Zinc finger protein ZIC 2 [Coemansia guatemalensis]
MPSSNAGSPEPRGAAALPAPPPSAPAGPHCAWGSCTAKFASMHQLSAHISATHVVGLDAETGLACAWRDCPQRAVPVSSFQGLVDHLRVHTGNRSYLCPVDGCGKVYKRSDFLARHISSHSAAAPPNGRARQRPAADALPPDSDAGSARSGKRKARHSPEAFATDSDTSMYLSHREDALADDHARPLHPAFDDADVPESAAHAVRLEAQLAYIRDQIAAREKSLARYRAKTRRLRLENDILIDALARV